MEKHTSVLLEESIKGLNLNEGSVVVDCTLGYGGHSSTILNRIPRGYLFAFDQDEDAVESSFGRLSQIGTNFEIIKSNFKNIKKELESRNVKEVDAVLYDLGVSSPQLDEASRGFSFHQNAQLDMRMDKSSPLSAYTVINTYDESRLAKIIYEYGEEKFARNIARNIVKERSKKEIETTDELVEIIRMSVPEKVRRERHPARKTFQAIRIEVNDELNVLEISLREALSILKVGGRISVITFHSLEDRIVKNIFKEYTEVDPLLKGVPGVDKSLLPDYKLVNTKPIIPSDDEINSNPRSRSAKLRIIERIK